MMSRILKYVAAGVGLCLLAFALYILAPSVSGASLSDSVPSSPIASENPCRAAITYVTEESRQYHEKEDYQFTVDDRCAMLQKQLVEAVRRDDVDEMTQLIGSGANAETADWSMFEPMFPLQAAVYQDPKTVKLLLDNGANPNREFCCCATCSSTLTIAIAEKRVETIRLLLDHGASVDYRPKFTDGERDSPVEMASKGGDQEIIDLVNRACQQQIACRARSRVRNLFRLFGR